MAFRYRQNDVPQFHTMMKAQRERDYCHPVKHRANKLVLACYQTHVHFRKRSISR